jgi:adenylate cyclase
MSGVAIASLSVAAAEFVALIVVLVLLVRSRRRARRLQLRLDDLSRGRLGVAGRAVRAVLDSAVRVREQGFGGFLASSLEDVTRWTTDDRAEITRVAAPDGTVTIVFSDIEDSTALNEELGDAAWVQLLEAHDALVRRHVGRHSGHVVKSQGDGFMIVFGDPVEGIGAAIDIQRAIRDGTARRLRRTPVRIRMGAHVGSAIARDGDYFGRNVALAARVAAQAVGGEVLVSAEVQERLSDVVVLTPRGSFSLKGFAEPHVLWAVECDL